MTMRGAQIDPTLCFLTTLVAVRAAAAPAARAGVGLVLRRRLRRRPRRHHQGRGLPAPAGADSVLRCCARFAGTDSRRSTAGTGGWRWWLAPLAMLLGDLRCGSCPCWWPSTTSGSPEYAAYRDEILFKQTVGRYAASWHHVKAWYYFIVEVIPALWLPWSLLLFWLVPRFKAAFQRTRRARLAAALLGAARAAVLLAQPGKRGVYIAAGAAGAGARRAALPRSGAGARRRAARGLRARPACSSSAAAVLAIAHSAGTRSSR